VIDDYGDAEFRAPVDFLRRLIYLPLLRGLHRLPRIAPPAARRTRHYAGIVEEFHAASLILLAD
jgi:hypothetical protein